MDRMIDYLLVTEEEYMRRRHALTQECVELNAKLVVIPDVVLLALEKSPEELRERLRPMLQEEIQHTGDVMIPDVTAVTFPQKKEECKHERGRWESSALFGEVYVCPDCPAGSCRTPQWAKKPQPKQKPSEWIKRRRIKVAQEREPGFLFKYSPIEQAIVDFLDKHAHLFTT